MASPFLPHRYRRSGNPSEKFVLFPASPLLSPLRDLSPKPPKKKKNSIFSFYHYYRSREKGEPEAPEPTSPKISCIGQVIAKQKKDKELKKDRERKANYPAALETDVFSLSSDDGVDGRGGCENRGRRPERAIKKYASFFRGLQQDPVEGHHSRTANEYADNLHHHDVSANEDHHHSVGVMKPQAAVPADEPCGRRQNISRNDEEAASVEKPITLKQLLDTEKMLSGKPASKQKSSYKRLPSLRCEGFNDSRTIVSHDVVPETWLLPIDESSSSSSTAALMSTLPRRSGIGIKQAIRTTLKDSSFDEDGNISSLDFKRHPPHHPSSSCNRKGVKLVEMNESECTDCIPVFPFANSSIHGNKTAKDEGDYFKSSQGNTGNNPVLANAKGGGNGIGHPQGDVKDLAHAEETKQAVLMCSEKICPTAAASGRMAAVRKDSGFALPEVVQRHLRSVNSLDGPGDGIKKNARSFAVQSITRLFLVGLANPKKIYDASWEARFNAGSTLFCPTGKYVQWLKDGAGAEFIRSLSETSHRTAVIKLQRSKSEPCKYS